MAINIIFDGPPAPEAGRFVEVEDDSGASIKAGEWVKRDDGYWALRITSIPTEQAAAGLSMSEQKDDTRNSGGMRCSSFEHPPGLKSAICLIVWLLMAFFVAVWFIDDYNRHHTFPIGNGPEDFHPFP